jgi:hypothetical protein
MDEKPKPVKPIEGKFYDPAIEKRFRNRSMVNITDTHTTYLRAFRMTDTEYMAVQAYMAILRPLRTQECKKESE